MEVNFGIEYLCTSVAISTLGGSASGGSCLRQTRLWREISFYLRASVVIILVCRTAGSALADPLEAEDPPLAGKTPEICRSEKDRDRKGP